MAHTEDPVTELGISVRRLTFYRGLVQCGKLNEGETRTEGETRSVDPLRLREALATLPDTATIDVGF